MLSIYSRISAGVLVAHVLALPLSASAQERSARATTAESIARVATSVAETGRAIASYTESVLRGTGGLAQLSALSALADYNYSADQASDSLYRQARAALQRGAYREAADLFMQVQRRDPNASLAADALYWHAYSMYRVGGTTGFETALSSLDRLTNNHPRAAVLGDARDLRMRVCGELARLGDEKCATEINNAAQRSASASTARSSSQARGCPSENDDERVAALNALLQMDSENALPLLERTLARRDECSRTLRKKAVFLVSQKRGSRAADILLNVVKTDPESDIRAEAVFWLGQIRDERAVDLLADILQNEKDAEVLDRAVFALGQHRSERAANMLRDLAQREGAPIRVREQAIFQLGQRRSGENSDLLMSLYSRVQQRELKDKIIFSISQSRTAAADKWLLDLARNAGEPMDLRKQALFWAGQSRSSTAQGIAEVYNSIGDKEMKEQAIFVLAQKKDSAAIDKLIDIARNDSDREMRGKAIFWLGQSRDPRVIKFLEELISK